MNPTYSLHMNEKKKTDWLKSIYPSRFQLGDIELLPLSIGHLLLLIKYKNAYSIHNYKQPFTYVDFIEALIIFSHTYKQNCFIFSHKWIFKYYYRKYYNKLNVKKVVEHHNKLMEYMVSYLQNTPSSTLNFQNNETYKNATPQKGVPILLAVETFFIFKTNMSLKEIYDVNIDRLFWWMASFSEMEGMSTIDPTVNPEFQPIMDTVANMKQKIETDPKAFNEIFKDVLINPPDMV